MPLLKLTANYFLFFV